MLLIQTYNQGRLWKTLLYNFKYKANACVGTAARFYACKSRTVAQKSARSRQVLRQANPKFLVACLAPTANAVGAKFTLRWTLPMQPSRHYIHGFDPNQTSHCYGSHHNFFIMLPLKYKIQIKFSVSYPRCVTQQSISHFLPSGNNEFLLHWIRVRLNYIWMFNSYFTQNKLREESVKK